MTSSSTSNEALLARLFQDPDARLGTEWLKSAGVGLTDTSLYSLVTSTGAIIIAKTREMYGHFCTRTQMQGTPGPYYSLDPTTHLTTETQRLNNPNSNSADRTHHLQTNMGGGILLVTQFTNNSGVSAPFITILGAHSIATFNPSQKDFGLSLEDI
jgi:hypothetical protein